MKSNLRQLRTAKAQTLEELGKALNICPRTLIRYEQGKKTPKLAIGYDMVKYFGVNSIEDIFPPPWEEKQPDLT